MNCTSNALRDTGRALPYTRDLRIAQARIFRLPLPVVSCSAQPRLRTLVVLGHGTWNLLTEAEELCDRVAIIDRGEIIALGSPNELKSSLVREDVVHMEGVLPSIVVERIRAIPGIRDVTVRAEAEGRVSLAVRCDNSRQLLPRMIEAATGDGASLEYIKPKDVTLEDVFIVKTGRTLAVDTREVVKEGGRGGSGGGG